MQSLPSNVSKIRVTTIRYRKLQQLSGKNITIFLGKSNATSNIPAAKQRPSKDQHTIQGAALGQHLLSTPEGLPVWIPQEGTVILQYLPLVETQQNETLGASLSVCQVFMSKSEPPRECGKNVCPILGSKLNLKNFQESLINTTVPEGQFSKECDI